MTIFSLNYSSSFHAIKIFDTFKECILYVNSLLFNQFCIRKKNFNPHFKRSFFRRFVEEGEGVFEVNLPVKRIPDTPPFKELTLEG